MEKEVCVPMESDQPIRRDTTHDDEFVRLFGLNHGRVFAYIVTLLPCWADAEEVLQRTSIALWQNFGQFDPSGDFSRWACGVAHRQALNYRRQQARNRRIFSESVMEKVASTRVARSNILEERRPFMDDCIAELPPSDREIIDRYYYQGRKTAAEVARELGRPTNTILKALIRIRRSLHRCVDRATSSEGRK
jgi:RNA polymerase sigma-70 factor, ECF subfamily